MKQIEKGFEGSYNLEEIFAELKPFILNEIKDKYGENSPEFLAYHNHYHTEHMLKQVGNLANLLEISEEIKAKVLVATLFHDYIFNTNTDGQEPMEVGEKKGVVRVRSANGLPNEAASAQAMIKALKEMGVDGDHLEQIREIILVTDAEFGLIADGNGNQYGTFTQPGLKPESSIEEFLIALPDLNLCGSEEFEDFLQQGNRVFRERYVGINQPISLSGDAKELDFWTKAMRTWAVNQVSFAKGRQIDFTNKVKTINDGGIFSEEQHQALVNYYSRFEDNINMMEALANKYKNMDHAELFRAFGYQVIE